MKINKLFSAEGTNGYYFRLILLGLRPFRTRNIVTDFRWVKTHRYCITCFQHYAKILYHL